MTTVVARRVASTPIRTATETWATIVTLLAPEVGDARSELESASGVVSMIIAEEVTADSPLVISGGPGPQVRVYTVHGERALDGDTLSESSLVTVPTIGDWTLALPVPMADVEWVSAKLAGCSHIDAVGEAQFCKSAAPQGDRILPVIDLGLLK